IYPNPAKDFLRITVPSTHKKFRFEMFDTSGKLVAAVENKTEISISHLESGNYVAKISSSDFSESQKIQIKK
ncbi:MAG: T9SS type A sorting domain-containing protein, partial [Clostridia bacterium]|nr:T9SS type A sorting domain-containing protein [Clostridia bacterium]